MYVVLDIEWTEQKISTQPPCRKLTQLSAVRVSGTWRAKARLDLLVRPEATKDIDWGFMAYSGYTPEQFGKGKCEGDCFEAFIEWLEERETVFCWHYETYKTLEELYKRYEYQEPFKQHVKCVCVKEKAEAALREKGTPAGGFYDALKVCGIEPAGPQHCAASDADAFEALLGKLGVSQAKLASAPPKASVTEAQKRQRNRNIIDRSGYKYIYAPGSKVFHCRGCRLVLGANNILGCVYYKKAADGRRPCKVCRPMDDAPPPPAAPAEKAAPEKADVLKSFEPKPDDIIRVKLLGGQYTVIKKKNVVGCCHNYIHPGKLTKKLMDQHDCIGKQCRFFEKYEDAAYWVGRASAHKQKAEAKEQKRLLKAKQASEAKTLDELREQFQSIIDEQFYPVQIIRLAQEKPNVFRVLYVSDNAFPDGNLYPNFYAAVMERYPSYRLLMRHIQDIDGHFVTRDEYRLRFGR